MSFKHRALLCAALIGLVGCETPRAVRPDLATIPLNRTSPEADPVPPAGLPDAGAEDLAWLIEGATPAPAAPAARQSPVRSFNVVFDQAPVAAVTDAVLGKSLRR